MAAIREAIRVHTRWMIRRDFPEVLEIEQAGFAELWSEEEFLRQCRQRNCIPMVAEHGAKVIGFMVFLMEKRRLDIINFAVHPQWRRRSVGTQMVAELIGKLSSRRREALSLVVSEANIGAQLFLRSQGFEAKSVLRGYFRQGTEDGYRMVYLLKEVRS